jgi:hypothetical protein
LCREEATFATVQLLSGNKVVADIQTYVLLGTMFQRDKPTNNSNTTKYFLLNMDFKTSFFVLNPLCSFPGGSNLEGKPTVSRGSFNSCHMNG